MQTLCKRTRASPDHGKVTQLEHIGAMCLGAYALSRTCVYVRLRVHAHRFARASYVRAPVCAMLYSILCYTLYCTLLYTILYSILYSTPYYTVLYSILYSLLYLSDSRRRRHRPAALGVTPGSPRLPRRGRAETPWRPYIILCYAMLCYAMLYCTLLYSTLLYCTLVCSEGSSYAIL